MEKAFLNGVTLPLNCCSRYVIYGDCHRGVGNQADNFLKNRHLYRASLEYYFYRNFYYLEIGDGEELWENRSLSRVKECYGDIYEIFARFKEQQRFYKIYGNHDMVLKNELPESIILNNVESGRDICILHGHQADFFNSVCWRISRFLVRYLWCPLEILGFQDPTSTAKNYKKAEKYEKCMVAFAKEKNVYLLAGHSHRPRLLEGELYINAGSCVHPASITAIEIENMQVTLVKWFVGVRNDRSLFVEREVLQSIVLA